MFTGIKIPSGGAFSPNRDVLGKKTLELNEWLWITFLHAICAYSSMGQHHGHNIWAEEKSVPTGKGPCPHHNMPAPAASLRQTLPGASQSKARLNQAGIDRLDCSFSLSLCAI